MNICYIIFWSVLLLMSNEFYIDENQFYLFSTKSKQIHEHLSHFNCIVQDYDIVF